MYYSSPSLTDLLKNINSKEDVKEEDETDYNDPSSVETFNATKYAPSPTTPANELNDVEK